MTPQLPQRDSFTRREVEHMLRLGGRVLDYWESEFNCVAPTPGVSGEKVYAREDVKILIKIKQWLVEERLDKETVRRRLDSKPAQPAQAKPQSRSAGRDDSLQKVRSGLREILTILEKSDTN